MLSAHLLIPVIAGQSIDLEFLVESLAAREKARERGSIYNMRDM
jgi:hypothetical protein